MHKRVALYVRISDDPNEARLGVGRQAEDGRLVAQARGWEVADVYEDNDISAYSRKVVRPAFERMLADLKAGDIDGIVVYDVDRFSRQPRDLERAIDIYEGRPGLVFATVQGDVDLQTADGRTWARMMVAFANKSSADTGRRVARKHLELARKGIPNGGFRAFGWSEDRISLHKSEAGLARKAIADTIAGRSATAICREWNDAGVTTTQGNAWLPRSLRQYLRNPRLAGYRIHHGEILMDEHGRPVEGQWEPLIDPTTWDRLQIVVSKPDGRGRIPRKGARRYLLTGLIRCGKCSALMYGNAQPKGRHNYVCRSEHRPMITASGESVDRLVGKLIVAKLASESTQPEMPVEWERQAELDQAKGSIDEMMSAFVAGNLSAGTVFPRVQALEEKVAEMENDRRAWLATTLGPVVHSLSMDDWKDMPIDEQRAYAESLLSAVLIKPLVKRLGNRLDPERVVPVWKKREGQQSALVALG